MVIIAQQRDDEAGAVESRVARRVTALGRIETGVIATGDSEADLATRSRIARRLLSAMTGPPHGQLLLAAAGNATEPARDDIMTLAGALCEHLPCRG